MVLVKTPKNVISNTKNKKVDLVTDFHMDKVNLVGEQNIPTEELIKMCDDKIDSINKKLERLRLFARIIECGANRTYLKNLSKIKETQLFENLDITNKNKGIIIHIVDENNGIYIH